MRIALPMGMNKAVIDVVMILKQMVLIVDLHHVSLHLPDIENNLKRRAPHKMKRSLLFTIGLLIFLH